MEAKSVTKTDKKDWYPKPKEIEYPKMIMYHGPRFSVMGGVMERAGFRFEEGVVYTVSDLVYEWAKRQRGFVEIKELRLDKKVDFKGKSVLDVIL